MFCKEVIGSFSEIIHSGERFGYQYIFGRRSFNGKECLALAVLHGNRVSATWNDEELKGDTFDSMLEFATGMVIPRDDARQWAKSCDKVQRLAQVLHSVFDKGELKPEDTVQVVAHHLAGWDDSFFRLVEAKRKFNKKQTNNQTGETA